MWRHRPRPGRTADHPTGARRHRLERRRPRPPVFAQGQRRPVVWGTGGTAAPPSGPRPTVGFVIRSGSADRRHPHRGLLTGMAGWRRAGPGRLAGRPAADGDSDVVTPVAGLRVRSARPSIDSLSATATSPRRCRRRRRRRWLRCPPGSMTPHRPADVAEASSSAARPAARSARRTASRRAASPSQCASTQPVESSARRNASLRATARWNGSGRLDAADLRLVERTAQPVDGGVAVVGVDHQLGDQVVVVGGDTVPRLDVRCRPGHRDRRASPSGRRVRASARRRGTGPRRRSGPRSRGSTGSPPAPPPRRPRGSAARRRRSGTARGRCRPPRPAR